MSKLSKMPIICDSYIRRINEIKSFLKQETNPEFQKPLKDALVFLQMKLIHTDEVYNEGLKILDHLIIAGSNDPKLQTMTKNIGLIGGITNDDASTIARQHFNNYIDSLVGHDVGRVGEHDDMGKPNFKLHPYLSYEMLENLSDIARIAILNHSYATAEEMYQKLDSYSAASEARDNYGHAEWMAKIQKDAFQRYNNLSLDDKIAVVLLSNMVRDADKLGNWKGIVRRGQQEDTPTMRRIFSSDHGRKNTISLSDNEMNAMHSNRVLKYFSDVTNFVGMNLANIMWASDFALKITNKTAAESKLAIGIVNYMDEYAQNWAAKNKNSGEYIKFLQQLGEIFETIKARELIGKETEFDMEGRMEIFSGLMSGDIKRPQLKGDGITKYDSERS